MAAEQHSSRRLYVSPPEETRHETSRIDSQASRTSQAKSWAGSQLPYCDEGSAAALLTVDRQILEKEKAGLARHNDIKVSVAIDVDHRNLQAPTRPATVVDNVPDPLEASSTMDGFVPKPELCTD